MTSELQFIESAGHTIALFARLITHILPLVVIPSTIASVLYSMFGKAGARSAMTDDEE